MTKVVKSTDEVMPSYHLQTTPKAETYTATAAKIMHAEQPAIRELSISKAPSQSPLKRSLNNLLSKIQGVFTPEPTVKKEPLKLNIKSQSQQANRKPALSAEPIAAPGTQESNGQRRNNNDRRRGNGNNNNRNGQKRDNHRDSSRDSSRGKPPSVPAIAVQTPLTAPAPIAKQHNAPSPIPKKSIPIVIDFSAPKAQEKMTEKAPVVISAKVQAILNQSSTTAHIQQVESKAVSKDKPVKIKKEEIIEKTDFSIDEARENIKQQHAKVGVRVETAVKSDLPPPSQKYAKDVMMVSDQT